MGVVGTVRHRAVGVHGRREAHLHRAVAPDRHPLAVAEPHTIGDPLAREPLGARGRREDGYAGEPPEGGEVGVVVVQVREQDGVRAPPGEPVGGVTAPAQDAGVAGEERVRHQPDALEVEDHGGVAEPRQPQAHGRIPRWRIHATSCRCTDSAPDEPALPLAVLEQRGVERELGRVEQHRLVLVAPHAAVGADQLLEGVDVAGGVHGGEDEQVAGVGHGRRAEQVGPGAAAVGQQRVLALDLPVVQHLQAAGADRDRPAPLALGHDDADRGPRHQSRDEPGPALQRLLQRHSPGFAREPEQGEAARGDDDELRRRGALAAREVPVRPDEDRPARGARVEQGREEGVDRPPRLLGRRLHGLGVRHGHQPAAYLGEVGALDLLERRARGSARGPTAPRCGSHEGRAPRPARAARARRRDPRARAATRVVTARHGGRSRRSRRGSRRCWACHAPGARPRARR